MYSLWEAVFQLQYKKLNQSQYNFIQAVSG